jgi:hypothetical protein
MAARRTNSSTLNKDVIDAARRRVSGLSNSTLVPKSKRRGSVDMSAAGSGKSSPGRPGDGVNDEENAAKERSHLHTLKRSLKRGYRHTAKRIDDVVFKGIPAQYPLYKKLALLKSNSLSGNLWEALMGTLALCSVVLYVSDTYLNRSWRAVNSFLKMDAIITAFFSADFIVAFLISSSYFKFFLSINTVIDLIAIVPFYVEVAGQRSSAHLGIFRFLRVFRLLRVIRVFRLIRMGYSPTREAIANLVITLFCTIFIGAGLFQIFENDIKQITQFKCNFIGPMTNWNPSCAIDRTFKSYAGSCEKTGYDDILSSAVCPDDACDCKFYKCYAFYNYFDDPREPSGIHCAVKHRTFFDCVYFMVVTIGTIGFGDVYPTTEASRFMVALIIAFSLIVIPLQLQRLAELVLAQVLCAVPTTHTHPSDTLVARHVDNDCSRALTLTRNPHPTTPRPNTAGSTNRWTRTSAT